jgi:hypothetical protein
VPNWHLKFLPLAALSRQREIPSMKSDFLAPQIERAILLIRGEKVMLSHDLARLYGVATKTLNRAVSRNLERFPEDFMFQLSAEEWDALRCQIGTSNDPDDPVPEENPSFLRYQIGTSKMDEDDSPEQTPSILRSQIVTSKPADGPEAPADGRGGSRVPPYAFTEQGVAMLSSVLRSPRAVAVNVAIMRSFVRLRQLLLTNADLAKKLNDMERKYDAQFKVVFDALRQLMSPPDQPRREMGFHAIEKSRAAAPSGKTRPRARRK